MKHFHTSKINPSITIEYYLLGVKGWSLNKQGVVDSPLALIADHIQRQRVIAEANDLVWPIEKDSKGYQRQSVKVRTDSGREWTTEINGTRLEVANYFLGAEFEYNENLPMDTAIEVYFINSKVG